MVFGLFEGNNNASLQPGFQSTPGRVLLVTGSSGLCGARLVEMLLERGARHVIGFDLAPPSSILMQRFQTAQATSGKKLTLLSGADGDLTSDKAVANAFTIDKIDIVYHIGALVGPFFDRDKYHDVNHYGTVRLLDQCKKHAVPTFVYSNSPSTRFTGKDIEGATEDELPMPETWLAMYAEAKAFGEKAVVACHSAQLKTISVAPHQVYGPHDGLMLPSLLEAAGTGRLRIFGKGTSIISVTFVDNYCHGLMCGADALQTHPDTVGGKFYIVTDDKHVLFWEWINLAVLGMGFANLFDKFHLPIWFLMVLARLADLLGYILNRKFKLNPFNVKMLTINRYFSIENAKRDLNYVPIRDGEEAWKETIQWFKLNWLPTYQEKVSHGKGAIIGLWKKDN
jgi:nucleoside-diphosphate-sugar epimerase